MKRGREKRGPFINIHEEGKREKMGMDRPRLTTRVHKQNTGEDNGIIFLEKKDESLHGIGRELEKAGTREEIGVRAQTIRHPTHDVG